MSHKNAKKDSFNIQQFKKEKRKNNTITDYYNYTTTDKGKSKFADEKSSEKSDRNSINYDLVDKIIHNKI